MENQQADSSASLQVTPIPTCKPLKRWGKSNERQQAVAIQRILEETIRDPDTPEASRASCAVAWTRVQEAKRIIDGKPLPGNLRPELAQLAEARKAKRAKPAMFAIPPEDRPASA